MLVTIAIYHTCIAGITILLVDPKKRVPFILVIYISSLGFHVQVCEHFGIYTMQDKRLEMQESAPPDM
jgi:hypothetical protein